ncbi:MAG: hypothetical protein LC808_08550 [Actinobacteria bacterium]|nr:hypothetical protein [Actinomycetota bacterium]
MACPLNPVDCVTGAIGTVAKAGAEGLADAFRDGAKWVIKTTVGWWLNIPSIDIASSPAGEIRRDVLYVSLVVAVGGMMWGGIRLAFRRKSEAAWDLGTGLIRLAATSSLAFLVVQLLLNAGDSFSVWVMNTAVTDDVADRMTRLAGMSGITAPGAVILVAILLILSGVVQAALMFLREGGIVVLTGVLILAAAGGFNPATKSWFPRVSGWLLALIFYKPFAALVYAAALHMIGTDDSDPRMVFVGITMIVLSIFALPAMMKFFSWAAPAAANAGGGGGALGALAGAGVAAMAMRGTASGGTASDQASHIRIDLGPVANSTGPSGASTAAAGPTGAAMGSPTAGAASAAAPAAGTGGAASGGAAAAGGPAAMAAMAAMQAASAVKEKASAAVTGGGDNA